MDKTNKSYVYIESEHSSRYIVTLCRHFARKVPSRWDESHGEVNFAMGDCLLSLEGDEQRLRIECQSDSLEGLNAVQNVLASHMQMFSRRETIELTWQSV